jgi:hypothetical protein
MRAAPAPPHPLEALATPAAVVLMSRQGTPTQEQLIEVRSDDGRVLPTASVHVTYEPVAPPWLAFTLGGDENVRTARVRATPFALAERPGVYAATIEFVLAGDPAPTVSVPVSLQVTASSGAACPGGSTLRYEGGGNGRREPRDFGRTFLATFCTGCHATVLDGAARNGAPPGLNWDTITGVRARLGWIDRAAAAGPNGVHYDMPPMALTTVVPGDDDRRRLGDWIACGAP